MESADSLAITKMSLSVRGTASPKSVWRRDPLHFSLWGLLEGSSISHL